MFYGKYKTIQDILFFTFFAGLFLGVFICFLFVPSWFMTDYAILGIPIGIGLFILIVGFSGACSEYITERIQQRDEYAER